MERRRRASELDRDIAIGLARSHSKTADESPEQIMARIRQTTRGDHEAMLRRVRSSPQAALAWLERVGSWPSSDPDIRAITLAAERRLGYRR